MTLIPKLTCLCLALSMLAAHPAKAQLEVANLTFKGFSAIGFGGFLNIGGAVSDADDVSGEVGFYYFGSQDSHVAIVPFLASFRHTLDGSGYGWYVEPFAGYTIGGTDIPKSDANGFPLYNSDGSQVDQKISGVTAGAGFGYLVQSSGRLQFNIGLRYLHVFVSGDPSPNMISLRISHRLVFGRSSE